MLQAEGTPDRQSHSVGDWLLAGEALIWLGLMRLAILLAPFRYIVRLLGLNAADPAVTSICVTPALAGRIGWSVQAAARRTPWESVCLGQALAGAVMLRLRNMPAIVKLGVAKSDVCSAPGPLAAHAWLCCGDQVLTGGGDLDRYAVLSSFSNPCAALAKAAP